MASKLSIENQCKQYSNKLQNVLATTDWQGIAQLSEDILSCWKNKSHIYICGNGGSAGNANHLANDLIYGIAKKTGGGLKVTSLSANSSVITCLANDVGYEFIYSEQLATLGNNNDILIVLSGSGNSKNIIHAIRQAKAMNIKSYAILGFDGGEAKQMADVAIHFPINDMQISEDLQLISGHIIMQYLFTHKDNI